MIRLRFVSNDDIDLDGVTSIQDAESALRRMGWHFCFPDEVPNRSEWSLGEGVWTVVSWWYRSGTNAYGALIIEGRSVVAVTHERATGKVCHSGFWQTLGYANSDNDALRMVREAGYEVIDDGRQAVIALKREASYPSAASFGVRVWAK